MKYTKKELEDWMTEDGRDLSMCDGEKCLEIVLDSEGNCGCEEEE